MNAHPFDPPVAKVITLPRAFHLDHLGPEVGQYVSQRVAGHQTGEIKDPYAVQRCRSIFGEFNRRQAEWIV